MQISETMSRDVHLASPDQSIREAARWMASLDVGALPVGENDRLVGMITDRDIAVRAVAVGLSPDTPIRDVMSGEIRYCFEDQSVEEVARNMRELQVRRLPVLSREKRLVGIVSLADLALEAEKPASDALNGISRRGGAHCQPETRH